MVCGNDMLAVGALLEAEAMGIDVPGALSVSGFDDIETAGFALPPLTTVRQDFAELGLAAVRTLVGRMAGEPAPPATLVQPALQVRASTAPPPRRGPGPAG